MTPFIQTQSLEKTLKAHREIWQKPKQNYEKAVNDAKYDYTERCIQLFGYGHRMYDYGREINDVFNDGPRLASNYSRAAIHLISGIWTVYWAEKKRLYLIGCESNYSDYYQIDNAIKQYLEKAITLGTDCIVEFSQRADGFNTADTKWTCINPFHAYDIDFKKE